MQSTKMSALRNKSFIDQLVVEDHVRCKRELIMSRAVVVGAIIVRMIESEAQDGW